MKRLVLLSFLLTIPLTLLSQVISRIEIDHDFYGRTFQFTQEPDYHPETGCIVLEVTANSYGTLRNPSIIEEKTNVKDTKQRESTLNAVKHCGFKVNQSAPDSVRSTITYRFLELSAIQVDSIQTEQLSKIDQRLQKIEKATNLNYFTLYPTENIWTFLELDTVYGCVYQIQFSTKGSDYRFRENISYEDLRKGSLFSTDVIIPGRFELFKTQNMYNFILLDHIDGRTWQVQWSMDRGDRGMFRIN